jgi:Rrf2 family protein
MQINRSISYAFLALEYMAKNIDQKAFVSQTISKEYNIPVEYLLKIMQQMVRAGILSSKRGPRGGFSFNMTPKQISMLQVIEAVDGPIMGQMNLFDVSINEKITKKAEAVYNKALEQAADVFAKTKLSDLI